MPEITIISCYNTKKIQISGYSKSDTISFYMWGTMIYAENWTFIDEGNSVEILPVAYAYVNSSNYNAASANDRQGVNMSWSSWNDGASTHVFTFDTAMEDADYNVVTDRNYESTNAIHIYGKTTTGFTAYWENGNPEVWAGTFIVYASTPTKEIHSSGSPSTEILPVAYAHVGYNNYNAINASDRQGVNLSWSSWNNTTNRHTFTFDTAMDDTDYNKLKQIFKDYDFEDYDSEEEEVSKTIRCIINFIEEEPESISI